MLSKLSFFFDVSELDLVSKFGEHQITFNVDHPFLFFIKDEISNTTVFIGKVVSPRTAPGEKTLIEKIEPAIKPVRKFTVSSPPAQKPNIQRPNGGGSVGSVLNEFGNRPQQAATDQGNAPAPDNSYQGFANEAAHSNQPGNKLNFSKPTFSWVEGPGGGIMEFSSNIDNISGPSSSAKPSFPSFIPAGMILMIGFYLLKIQKYYYQIYLF